MRRIDTDRLRQNVDLIELAGQVSTLRKWSAKELAGPCPKCGGDDRLHVQRDWWFCRQCWPADNGKPHDAIAWLEWLHGVDFLEAVRLMGSNTLPALTVKATPVAKTPGWMDATWQAAARHDARIAATALDSANGEPARAYLASRGILPDTWRAWGLGCGVKWNPYIQAEKPAIVLPWREGDNVHALAYRFFGADIGKPARFTQKGDGERTLFGLGMLRGGDALLLIEGELNAISVWQASRDIGLDVVSFGAESNATSDAVIELAGRYKRVVVWADEADKASAAMAAIPDARGLRSVVKDGEKLDANALLQRGVLRDYLAAVLPQSDVLMVRLLRGFNALQAKEAAGETGPEYERWLAKFLHLLYAYEDMATAEGR
jgi:hypothetical protein